MAVDEEKKEPISPEEQAKADAELLEVKRQERESQRFMRSNPTFPRGVRGAEILRGCFIEKHGYDAASWTAENLEEIWNLCDRDSFDYEDDNRPDAIEPVPEPTPEPVDDSPNFPWGKSLTVENDGPRRVSKMSGAEMQKYLKNRNTGREFARQVDALGLTREQLKHNGEVSQ